ncbi:hypothetical protein [Pacificoceanicola onchidii]|uniref:hypothetical protein n=1 Tax=Pacificoceanicola onchidii TaxID=2562685 RepID=UPI0010A69CA4|nr:hypothetical protein [Pacificoceanicola onchidii]
MTSTRSDYSFSYWTLLIVLAVLGLWAHAGESVVSIAFGGAVMSFGLYRDHKRRSTLRQREDGVYVWIEWHGGERRSFCDPTEDWDSEGDGDGGD